MFFKFIIMKIVIISDTHNRHKKLTSNADFPNRLPEGDLLIHCGDFTGVGTKSEVENFIEWLLKIRHMFTYGIVFIAGNHDRSFDSKYMYEFEDYDLFDMHQEPSKPFWLNAMISDARLKDKGIYYLENSSIDINGLKIWGSPVTPWFYGDRWAFNKHRGEDIREVWRNILATTDILVTHGPPSYKLDHVPYKDEYVGCEDLYYAIQKVKPKINCFGHIHEDGGKFTFDADTMYINASICNHSYEAVNKPIVVEIDEYES